MWQLAVIILTVTVLMFAVDGCQALCERNYRRSFLGAFITLPLCSLLGYAIIQFLDHPGAVKDNNFGFGPDWQCTNIPNGEPVCVKSHS